MSMSADEMIAVIQAHKEGKQIQHDSDAIPTGWVDDTDPKFDFHGFRYRIKPSEPKKVKLLCWFGGESLVWKVEGVGLPDRYVRIPNEDKEIEIPGE